MKPQKILFVASEVAPFYKTGGLADVVGSLPKALAKKGMDVRVVMPKYQGLASKYRNALKSIGNGQVDMLFRAIGFEIFILREEDVTFYFIEHNVYFEREGYYGYPDDGERFTFFSKAALEMLPIIGFKPDVLHAHDWQTSATTFLLRSYYLHHPFYRDIKTVFTIHNMKYQGVFPKEVIHSLLGIDWEHFTHLRLEFFDQVNYLKGAINYSDVVTTVSNTYSEEILHDFFAENLGGTLRNRSHALKGIVNGIDYTIYDPSTDKKIFHPFDCNDRTGKAINKAQLQAQLGLPQRSNVPVFALITRLVEQKGLDLIDHVFHEILMHDIQFIILGTGEYRYEEMFKNFAYAFPEKVSANISFNNVLAHRIYAGSDFFVMPSLFEPCGLSQIISMRYGTIPIVRETGGLKDTVIPYNEYTQEGTGLSFTHYNAHELLDTVKRSIDLYQKPEQFEKLQVNAMQQDFSWEHSATLYADIYNQLFADIYATS